MDRARSLRISKLLSFALRHDPAALGLVLDGAGWSDVALLLVALRARGEDLTPEELADLVRANDKQRFALSEDGTRIRANQGHSVDVDLGLAPSPPPPRLFHGTVDRFLESIGRAGLVRGARTHVHLSADATTARRVAARRKGTPVVLVVRADAMARDGITFHLSANGVWLVHHVPPAYLDVPSL